MAGIREPIGGTAREFAHPVHLTRSHVQPDDGPLLSLVIRWSSEPFTIRGPDELLVNTLPIHLAYQRLGRYIPDLNSSLGHACYMLAVRAPGRPGTLAILSEYNRAGPV